MLLLGEELSGLEPRARACVGAGISREELKDFLFRQGLGFVSSAITTVQELALECLGREAAERSLGASTRQEILRQLLSEPRISARLPELRALRRGGAFFRRLDEALQSARLAFGSPDEERVMMERLQEKVGGRAVRDELLILSRAYEAWLTGIERVDPPLILKAAAEALENGSARPAWPERIYCFSTRAPESLEQAFWDQAARRTQVVKVGPEELFRREETAPERKVTWERWHTIDDAAERLACSRLDFDGDVVLIPDSGEARRSLGRALQSRGVPLADPRDPTRLRWEEPVKWALLPLQAVASRFERARVIAYLRGFESTSELPAWIEEINARGLRDGLLSYSGGLLAPVGEKLARLAGAFPSRVSAHDAGITHLEMLKSAIELRDAQGLAWLLPLFESLWTGLESDALLVGRGGRPAPLLYWLERLTQRLADTPAPVERLKPERGLRLYRLYQASPLRARRVFLLGMPADWLGSERTGGYWLSERERETLSSEFAVRSRLQARAERLAVLKGWISGADEVVLLDAAYSPDGRERESIAPLLAELGLEAPAGADGRPGGPEELGAHPRWVESYRALRPLQPQSVQLPAALGARELSATTLDNYSRCGLQSLARDRWKLKDAREPDHDPWPDARGTILHEAVRVLVASRDANGAFAVTEEQAIEEAWRACRPRGLLKGERIRRLSQERMVEWLKAFSVKEREYFERAGTKALALESKRFRLEFPEGAILGKPDRIDEHPEGLFVIDYKTSSDLPNGSEMIDLGYRLQLPFYALAAERELKKPVIGMQFIELSRRASRSHGIFLKQYNGKQPGSLTKTTSNSRSLRSEPREEIWEKLETQIRGHVAGYLSGLFEARPKLEAECPGCFASDLCGKRRKLEELEEGVRA